MNLKSILFLIGAICFLSSCKNDKTTEQTTKQTVSETCKYSMNKEKTYVGWTAFKTTEKLGVKGQFKEFDVQLKNESATNSAALLSGATFSIPVKSTSTGDLGRDQKVVEHFFGSMKETESIKGAINSLKDGKANVTITMNGISKNVDLEYAITADGSVSLKGGIDVTNWSGVPAIQALNKICYDLHKGADGVSKLWNTVDLNINIPLNKSCE